MLHAFPRGFLFLGQGYWVGGIPAQLPIFIAVAAAFWLFLHRTTIGRGLVCHRFFPRGCARYADCRWGDCRIGLRAGGPGLEPCGRDLRRASWTGEGRRRNQLQVCDHGRGAWRTSISAAGDCGRHNPRLFAIAVLQNGLRLADLPAELAGVLTGALLLAAIGLDRRSARTSAPKPVSDEVMNVRNSQVAVICAVILMGAAIVAASNVYLVRSLVQGGGGRGRGDLVPAATLGGPSTAEPADAGRTITVAMMPKSKGNAYFVACRKGAEEAAKEFGVKLIWDGPTDPDPAKQNEVIDTWITRGVDVIAVAVENRQGISSVLRKARSKGIKVITWDADAEPDARDFFVNQATPEGIGQALMDNAARIMGGKGEFSIITASLTAGNMIEWQKTIEARRAKYPQIKMAAFGRATTSEEGLRRGDRSHELNPNVKLFMGICTPAVPGAPKRSSRRVATT